MGEGWHLRRNSCLSHCDFRGAELPSHDHPLHAPHLSEASALSRRDAHLSGAVDLKTAKTEPRKGNRGITRHRRRFCSRIGKSRSCETSADHKGQGDRGRREKEGMGNGRSNLQGGCRCDKEGGGKGKEEGTRCRRAVDANKSGGVLTAHRKVWRHPPYDIYCSDVLHDHGIGAGSSDCPDPLLKRGEL